MMYEITKTGLLVIDEGNLIFDEYRAYLSFAGEPGAGDYFFKWLVDNRHKPDRVVQVALAEDPMRPGEFAAFPVDEELAHPIGLIGRLSQLHLCIRRNHLC